MQNLLTWHPQLRALSRLTLAVLLSAVPVMAQSGDSRDIALLGVPGGPSVGDGQIFLTETTIYWLDGFNRIQFGDSAVTPTAMTGNTVFRANNVTPTPPANNPAPDAIGATRQTDGTPFAGPGANPADDGFVPLFPNDGKPEGWLVREWSDLGRAAPAGNDWTVREGVLHSGQQRGTWLVSERVYGDFILKFEIRLTARGNSGIALRAPLAGDPAFDGLELQFADFRYNTGAKPSELTGGIYRAIAPTEQVYKPEAWNRCVLELRGTRLKATINGVVVQDVDLATFTEPVKRHDGSLAPPVRDRPREGHIGFQHLSRNNEPVIIRGASIKELGKGSK